MDTTVTPTHINTPKQNTEDRYPCGKQPRRINCKVLRVMYDVIPAKPFHLVCLYTK